MAEIDFSETKQWLRTARTLVEALPYLRRYDGEAFVIKYGGHAMGDEKAAASFAQDIVLLKQAGINPVVVHGGGPQINQMLDRLKIKSEYVRGLRDGRDCRDRRDGPAPSTSRAGISRGRHCRRPFRGGNLIRARSSRARS